MMVSSLEYCASSTIKRVLVDAHDGSESNDRHLIFNQICNEPRFHIHLENILATLVENQPDLVKDDIIKLLLSGSIHLKRLNLRDCSNISIYGFALAVKNQPYLVHLDISGCKNLAQVCIGNVLAENLPFLESLFFESCDCLNDDTVKAIISRCIHLKFLSLACSPMLTDEIFNFNPCVNESKNGKRILGQLSRIDLSGCQGISSTSIRSLFSLCGSTLRSVNISWTKIDCTALVYLSGFSLSSAVYVATHAGDKNMPFSVAELEASQEFEFQMANFKSGNSGDTAQQRPDISGSPALKQENTVEDSEEISFVNNNANQPVTSNIIEIGNTDQSFLKNFQSREVVLLGQAEDAAVKQEHACDKRGFDVVSSDDIKYMADFSANLLLCKLAKSYCFTCSSKKRSGLKRTHSYGCILDLIQNKKMIDMRHSRVTRTEEPNHDQTYRGAKLHFSSQDFEFTEEVANSNSDQKLMDYGRDQFFVKRKENGFFPDVSDFLRTAQPNSSLNDEESMHEAAFLKDQGLCLFDESRSETKSYNGCKEEREEQKIIDDLKDSNIGTSEIETKFTSSAQFYKPRQMLMSQISELDISQIVFYDSEVGINCIKMFVNTNHSLKSLNISWQGLTDSILEEIAKNEPELVNLGLVECEHLSNFGIVAVGQHCKKLVSLDLQGVPFISDRGIYDVLSHGILEELSLAECAITDLTLQNINKFCGATMTYLNLSWCENVTDIGVANLVQSCSSLQSINTRQCEISSKTIKTLTRYGKKLTYLGLCSVQDLTDSLVIPLVQSLRNLTFIDLSWNCMVTDEGASSLLASCSTLREVVLAGLKLITSKPFLPIISNLAEWRFRRELIRSRLQREMVVAKTRDISAHEILDASFYLPYRSLHYARNLQKIDLSFSDKVNDTHLAELVSVCRGTLTIDDYYSMPIKPRWNF